MNRTFPFVLVVGLALAACSSSSSGGGDGGTPPDAKVGDTGSPEGSGADSPSGCSGCCCPPPIPIDGSMNTCSVSNQCNLIGCGACPG